MIVAGVCVCAYMCVRVYVLARYECQARMSFMWSLARKFFFLSCNWYLFYIMSDGIRAARRQKLWCRKWISLVLRRSLYHMCSIGHTLPDPSSVVPAQRFAATMGHYLIKIWSPKQNLFWNIIQQKSSIGSQRRACPLGFATRRPVHRPKYTSTPFTQDPVPGFRHFSCGPSILVRLCVCAFICACVNV